MQSFPPAGRPSTPPPPPVATLPGPSRPVAQAWASTSKSGQRGPRLPRLPHGKRAVVAVAGALVLVLVAVAAYRFVGSRKSSPPSKTTLALTLTKGKTIRYQFVMKIAATGKVGGATVPADDQLTGLMTWHVDSVSPQGVATITARAPQVTEVSTGRKPAHSAQTFHLKIGPDGRVPAEVGFGTTSGKSNSGPGLPGSDQITPLLPDHPVAVGESWTTSFDQTNPMGTGVIHYQTTSKLLRYAQVGDVNTAVIYTTADLPIDVSLDTRKALLWTGQPTSGLVKGENPVYLMKGHMSFSQTAWIDTATNTLFRSSTGGQFVLVLRMTHIDPRDQPPGGKIDVTGSVSIDLQRP